MPRLYRHGIPKNVLIHFIPTDVDTPSSRMRRDIMTSSNENDVMPSSLTTRDVTNRCTCEPGACVRVPFEEERTDAKVPKLDVKKTYYIYVELENDVGCNGELTLVNQSSPIIISRDDQG